METVRTDVIEDDSSSSSESDFEIFRLTGPACCELGEVARQKSAQRLPRKKGHYKLKIRHQAESITGMLARCPEISAVHARGETSHSETMANMKEEIDSAELLHPEPESPMEILATRCLSSQDKSSDNSQQPIQSAEEESGSGASDVDHQPIRRKKLGANS